MDYFEQLRKVEVAKILRRDYVAKRTMKSCNLRDEMLALSGLLFLGSFVCFYFIPQFAQIAVDTTAVGIAFLFVGTVIHFCIKRETKQALKAFEADPEYAEEASILKWNAEYEEVIRLLSKL